MTTAERLRRSGAVTGLMVLVLAPAAAAQAPPAPPAWMAGCWRQDGPNHTVEEVWLRPVGGATVGVSRTMAADTLLLWELMIIRPVEGALAFEAAPRGQASARFKVIEFTDSTIAFENPEHDFPQRIRYIRRPGDSLLAAISGPIGGRARTINFEYARTPCPA